MKWNIGIIKNINKILSDDLLNIYKDINILFLDKYIKINFGVADPFIFKNYIFGETLHYKYLI